jgi:hypothetical protein
MNDGELLLSVLLCEESVELCSLMLWNGREKVCAAASLSAFGTTSVVSRPCESFAAKDKTH